MEFIKIRFTNDFDQMGSKFEKTISEMFHTMNPMFSFAKSSWKPPIDIFETPDSILITAEIAGVEKEDLELEINSRAIRISGKRTPLPSADNGRYRLAEIQYGLFERIMHLPVMIDPEKVTASYKKGLLQINLAKLTCETSYKIPISDE
jgi:HSP20 family protein